MIAADKGAGSAPPPRGIGRPTGGFCPNPGSASRPGEGRPRAGPGGAGPGRLLPLAALGTSRRSHTAGKLFLRPGPAPADVALSVPLPRRAGVAETRAGARRCQAAGQGGGGGVRCPSGAGRGVPGVTERRARGGKPCGKGRLPAPRRQKRPARCEWWSRSGQDLGGQAR